MKGLLRLILHKGPTPAHPYHPTGQSQRAKSKIQELGRHALYSVGKHCKKLYSRHM